MRERDLIAVRSDQCAWYSNGLAIQIAIRIQGDRGCANRSNEVRGVGIQADNG